MFKQLNLLPRYFNIVCLTAASRLTRKLMCLQEKSCRQVNIKIYIQNKQINPTVTINSIEGAEEFPTTVAKSKQ